MLGVICVVLKHWRFPLFGELLPHNSLLCEILCTTLMKRQTLWYSEQHGAFPPPLLLKGVTQSPAFHFWLVSGLKMIGMNTNMMILCWETFDPGVLQMPTDIIHPPKKLPQVKQNPCTYTPQWCIGAIGASFCQSLHIWLDLHWCNVEVLKALRLKNQGSQSVKQWAS